MVLNKKKLLRKFFPNSDEDSKFYGGFMMDETVFCRIFPAMKSIKEMLVEVNIFLILNGYSPIEFDEINDDMYVYDKFPITLSPHGYQEEFVIFVNKEPFS